MKKFIVIIIILIIGAFVGYYFGYDVGFERDKDSAETEENGVDTSSVNYYKDVKGYLARPEQEGEYPAIILIHEWWGLNDNIKDFAKKFSSEGYVALAVDLYSGQVTDSPDQARVLATGVRGDMEEAFANLQAAADFLKADSQVREDSLASVGWCFGGGWSYQMAKNDLDVDASVIYYGQFNPEDDLSQMRSTILGHFGEDDSSISVDDVQAFQATLQTLSGDHEIFIYPNSAHAFANEGGLAYNAEAASLAWQRTLEFLTEELQ